MGSDLAASSTRGSEERSSAAPQAQAQRGTKRGREIEGIDKVGLTFLYLGSYLGGFVMGGFALLFLAYPDL